MQSTVTLQSPLQFSTEPLTLGITAATSGLLQRVVGQVAWLIQQRAQLLKGVFKSVVAGQDQRIGPARYNCSCKSRLSLIA